MAMSIRTNMAALSSINTLGRTQGNLSNSLERISSGLRINRAADDAAGLGVATRMEADNTSLQQAMRNTNDGISMIQTAEGSLEQLTNIMTRVRELTVQSANETYSSSDRTMISTEMTQLKNEFERITATSEFNEQNLLNATAGTSNNTITIHVGMDGSSNDRIQFTLTSFSTDSTQITALASVFAAITAAAAGSTTAGLNQASAAAANLGNIDTIITALSTRRATIGALQNRFENALAEASTLSQNMSASQSQILDVDYASESANMTRFQIQQQAGVAALAQAKAMPQSIISLLN
jgi:flagellin